MVVLAHGFLMDRSMFDAQIPALAPDVRVITWDARGFGRTEWDGKPFSYWDLADDVLALLDHLGVRRAVLGGMSQGGFVALRAALRAPERVAGLALMSTQAGVDPDDVIARYRSMVEAWTNMGAVEPLVEAIASIILGAPEHWLPWTERWKALLKENVYEPAMCLLTRDDITVRLGEIDAPAIVFHGTADSAIPMERAEVLAGGLRGCLGLVKVDGGAHAANVTHPAQVNGPLREFLRAVSA